MLKKYKLQSTFTTITFLIIAVLITQKLAIAADIVIYKSSTCECCKNWVTHMKNNGYSVEIHNRRNLQPIKQSLGIPQKLQSCHTAQIGNYLIEGHVPADLVTKILKEKPAIKGLAVPGMVMGSPGMEGRRKDAYDVIAFDKNGNTSVYAKR